MTVNEEQQTAITYNDGPLMIVAGAGTGKTHCLVEKVKYLIKNDLAKPEQILALTFTEKAATEMEERIDVAMPYGYFQMWVSTFHSFADQLLKEEAYHIGLNSGYRLITEAESIIFLRQNLFLFNLEYFRPLGNPHRFLTAMLQHFSRLRDEDISPEQYLTWVKKLKDKEHYQELADAYKAYQALKTKEGLMDFSDLVYYLLKLFRDRPNVLEKYRRQFTHVLVDEFQDTNISQYSLIKLLCPPKTNPHLTVVGDDSQAIYKFRGASVSNILDFMKDYPQANQVTLLKNYRSNQTILDAAYQLIKHNDPDTLEAKLGISKKLVAQIPNSKDSVRFYWAQKAEEEADCVAEQMQQLGKTYRYSDFAVLTRAHNHSDVLIQAFSRKGIPYQFLGPGMLFKQPEIKDLIAYLKVLNNIEDSVSLYRVLLMDIFHLDTKDINLLMIFSKKVNQPLLMAIEIYLSFIDHDLFREEWEIYRKYLPFFKKETKDVLAVIFKMIKHHLDLTKKETAGQLLFFFLEDTKYLNRLTNYKTAAEEKIALNISKFFSKLKSYESAHENASVPAVIDYIEMSMELGESPMTEKEDVDNLNAVNILTVHSAKGLEFPVVFLINLTRGRFPTYGRREPIPIPPALIKEILPEGDYHEEEERRLFYVGLTRAKDYVYLSASRFYGEGKREQKISPFAIETVGKELIKKMQVVKKEEKSQLSIFDFKKSPIPSTSPNPLTSSITNFSYTQLETYERCPLQYRYQYMLKIPTAPAAALSFGETIHKTLQQFYQEFMKNKNYDEKNIFTSYKKLWIPVGYASAAHETRMKKEGENILKRYLTIFHHPQLQILGLEKLFKIKIANDIFVTGKIDRIDKLNNNVIEIIDYKTGKKPEQKELEKSVQLSIYALAAIDDGLYRKKIGDVRLSFYFLNDMEKVSLTRTMVDLETVKTKIIETADKIRHSDFTPKAGPWCNFCAFRMLCEAWQ